MSDLIHVGFENHLALDRVLAVATPGSAPMKRMIQRGKDEQRVIDLTSGRRTKAVVVMDNEWVALLAITPETFAGRAGSSRNSNHSRVAVE